MLIMKFTNINTGINYMENQVKEARNLIYFLEFRFIYSLIFVC